MRNSLMHDPSRCPVCMKLRDNDHSEALKINSAMLRLTDADFVVIDEPSSFALVDKVGVVLLALLMGAGCAIKAKPVCFHNGCQLCCNDDGKYCPPCWTDAERKKAHQ